MTAATTDECSRFALKIAFQNADETGEDDQIHLGGLQCADKSPLRFLVQLGAKFSRRNELRRNFPVACVRENSRTFNIAQDDGDFGWNLSGSDGIGKRDKVRAFAGADHANAK